MKKILAAFLVGVMFIAGINCTKEPPYRIKKSPNVFFRGVGINVNGEAQSYSVIRQYVKNPKKKNERRFSLGDAGSTEIWGNTPEGQLVVKVKNIQTCPNNISIETQGVSRTKFFEVGQSDTFHVNPPDEQFSIWVVRTDTDCGVFDIDALGPPNNSWAFNIEELPMHFSI